MSNLSMTPQAKPYEPTSSTLVSVLIVEDTAIAQTSIVSLLSQFPCQAVVAGTGQEAIDCVQDTDFDLIFMDIGLPDIDVLTVTEAIQQHYQQQQKPLPVILALTAHSTDYIKTQCFQAGMQAFYVKPLTRSNAEEIFAKYI